MAAPTLHYFDLYARGEMTRMIFHYNGAAFTDHRIQFGDWPAFSESFQPDFGQLPVLEIDGLKLVESNSISRYLSQKFGYYPSDPVDIYWVESLCDLKNDIFTAIGKAVWDKDPQVLADVYAKDVPWWIQKIESRLVRNNGGDGWFVGNSVTRADLEIFELLWDGILRPELKDKFGALIDGIPKLKEFVQRFLDSSPTLKAYIDARPSCEF